MFQIQIWFPVSVLFHRVMKLALYLKITRSEGGEMPTDEKFMAMQF